MLFATRSHRSSSGQRSATRNRRLRWFSRCGQFTRIGHIPGGGRPLLREGGPISYESASFHPNPPASPPQRSHRRRTGGKRAPPPCTRSPDAISGPIHQTPEVNYRPRFQNDDFPCRLNSQSLVCRGNQPLRKPRYSSLLVAGGDRSPIH